MPEKEKSEAAEGERSWRYREQVARIPRNFGYVAADPLTGKPVPFDGHRPGAGGEPGTLLQALGPCEADPLLAPLPTGRQVGRPAGRPAEPVIVALNAVLDLAERQARAARGRPVEWHAPGADTAAAIDRILHEHGLADRITVIHTPAAR
jgi:hypothetical protein